ncbi:MAG: divalent-cation tolerance protein CutA [Phycisphaerales bacterium]|nr:divalent-cation tolerance protein CutA [Phycisphaerales bacterium]
MDAHDKPVLIYATYPDTAVAEASGRALVEEGLAACVNILPGMVSLYRWEGAVERGDECVMIIKTRAGLADRVIAAARARHPYTTPAFVVLPVEGGLEAYLDWIAASTRPD